MIWFSEIPRLQRKMDDTNNEPMTIIRNLLRVGNSITCDKQLKNMGKWKIKNKKNKNKRQRERKYVCRNLFPQIIEKENWYNQALRFNANTNYL